MPDLILVLFSLVQGVGLFTLALALVLFRTKPYKQEYVLFGLTGVTIIIVSGLLLKVVGWFI